MIETRTVDLDPLAEALRRAADGGADYADAFVEATAHTHAMARQRLGRVTPPPRLRHHTVAGCALRALQDDAEALVTADGADATAAPSLVTTLLDRFDRCAAAPAVRPTAWTEPAALPPDAPNAITDTERAALLTEVLDAALGLDEDVRHASVAYRDVLRRTWVATTEGRAIEHTQVGWGLRLEVLLEGDPPATAHAVIGGGDGFAAFAETAAERLVREATQLARMRRAARSMPMGPMPVVLAGGWGGVWLHEAVGHLLEADVAEAGPFAGRLGQQVAAPGVTLIDAPAAPSTRATYTHDDEGTPAARTTLLDDGRLAGWLTDRRRARRRGLPRTGHGRRQDYRHAPLPRMSTLLLQPGEAAPEALVAEARDGLYVEAIGHGQVRPDGRFTFDVLAGRRIEGGRLTHPVADLRLTGTAPEALRALVGVASDQQVDHGRGDCAKAGQVVPVAIGMPTVLLRALTVEPAGV